MILQATESISWSTDIISLNINKPEDRLILLSVLVLLLSFLAAAAKSLQSCLTLCNPRDGSPSDSSIPGILQARTLDWVAISFSNACMHAKLLQSCLTLCDPMDSSPPGFSVHGIFQARILEWVAISFSKFSYTARRSLFGEGNGAPLQYSCLENPMDGGACRLQSMGSLGVGRY